FGGLVAPGPRSRSTSAFTAAAPGHPSGALQRSETRSGSARAVPSRTALPAPSAIAEAVTSAPRRAHGPMMKSSKLDTYVGAGKRGSRGTGNPTWHQTPPLGGPWRVAHLTMTRSVVNLK